MKPTSDDTQVIFYYHHLSVSYEYLGFPPNIFHYHHLSVSYLGKIPYMKRKIIPGMRTI